MRGAQQMIDVGEGRFRQRPHRLARHHQHFFAQDALDAHASVAILRYGVWSLPSGNSGVCL